MRFNGEPDLDDLLSDPIVQALMRADGLDRQALRLSLGEGRDAFAAARRGECRRCVTPAQE